MPRKALVVLAEGFEDVEAVTAIDVLRRAEIEVTVAGLGSETVKGARGVVVKADTLLEKADDMPDAIVLPGGMPGAENLARSTRLKDLIVKLDKAGKLICAICAAPALVLEPTGVLEGKKATCYPGMEKSFSPLVKFTKENVVQDRNVITSRGPATAIAFGLKIAENLVGKAKADMIGEHMLV
ncbi:MAG: DJ-1/PfpI family protein [Candidatus Omnitrophica bacterium]|nr:DJ-1/PfpI family protein [Candidatus Omnitrophota bacterium]MDD5487766.1 DJ-1/PfpI family protein [Candidatus Omnitrophota bacterium]